MTDSRTLKEKETSKNQKKKIYETITEEYT